eukprot:54497-Amphidinium_carterae.1
MYELAYKKQSTKSKTISITDLTDSTRPSVRHPKDEILEKLPPGGEPEIPEFKDSAESEEERTNSDISPTKRCTRSIFDLL